MAAQTTASVVTDLLVHQLNKHTVTRDTTYLVRNGIEPSVAVQRVIQCHRNYRIWGAISCYAAPLYWLPSGGAVVLLGEFSANYLLAQTFSLGYLVGGLVLLAASIVLYWAIYILPFVRLWRACARGCEWEDAQPWWRWARRPTEGTGAMVDCKTNKTVATVIAVPGLLIFRVWIFFGVIGGSIGTVKYFLELAAA
jgi:hypothetical protein